MNDLNQYHNQLIRETVAKLIGAVGKIKLNHKMSDVEADKIRKEIDEVKAELFAISDINPDIKHIELFKDGANLVEEILNTLTRPYAHLI